PLLDENRAGVVLNGNGAFADMQAVIDIKATPPDGGGAAQGCYRMRRDHPDIRIFAFGDPAAIEKKRAFESFKRGEGLRFISGIENIFAERKGRVIAKNDLTVIDQKNQNFGLWACFD